MPVVGNTYYVFSDWYKSNTDSSVSMGYYLADGSLAWSNLNFSVPASANWTLFTRGFIVPPNATSAFFIHFMPHSGWLETDDESMVQAPRPPGFSRPIVSITLDDGDSSQIPATQLMDTYGYKSTDYIPTGGIADGSVWSAAQILNAYNRGHEIAAHTVTHPDLTTLSASQLTTEVTQCKTTLENIIGKGKVTDFATPYGAYNTNVINALKVAGYASQRSVDEGYNTAADLNPWDIRVQNMLNTTTIQDFQNWINNAVSGHYWLVIVYHTIVPDPSADPYGTSTTLFQQQLNSIKASGITVLPVNAALAEVSTQAH